jgi:hypothetical protein
MAPDVAERATELTQSARRNIGSDICALLVVRILLESRQTIIFRGHILGPLKREDLAESVFGRVGLLLLFAKWAIME